MSNIGDEVEAAAKALIRGEDGNWELARRTAKNTRGGAGRPDNSADIRGIMASLSMVEWCERVRGRAKRKFSEQSGVMFKRMWMRYGHLQPEERPEWSEGMKVLDPDHYDSKRVQARVDAIAVEKHLTHAPPEARAQTAVRLLADAEVVAQAIPFGSPLSRALADAIDTQRALREERTERIIGADRISQLQRSATTLTTLTALLHQFASDIETKLPHLRELPGSADDPTAHAVFLREAVVRAESALAAVKAFLETGRVGGDVEQFVRGVLRNGER